MYILLPSPVILLNLALVPTTLCRALDDGTFNSTNTLRRPSPQQETPFSNMSSVTASLTQTAAMCSTLVLNATTRGPSRTTKFTGTTPYTALSTITNPRWTTIPAAQFLNSTEPPFCLNHADPHQGVSNHCMCRNNAIIEPIPIPTAIDGQNGRPAYQPCAYTTYTTATQMT